MTEFGFRSRSGICSAVLLAVAAVAGLVAPRPAMADEVSVRHVVTFAQVEPFEGAVAPVTIVCPSKGTCTGRLYLAARGEIHEYGLTGTARGDGRITLSVLRVPSISRHPDDALRRSAVPNLSFGQGDSFDVVIQPDGAGLRDVAVTALLYDRLQEGMDHGIFVPPPPKGEQRVQLANVRVTVRRTDAAEERGR
jgi:hypothetical protein